MSTDGLTYLAAPYSHENKSVVLERMRIFYAVDAALMRNGYATISPLLKHEVARQAELPTDWTYWQHYSETLLSICKRIIIIKMDGWDSSAGVKGEIEFAQEHNIPVEYYNIGDL